MEHGFPFIYMLDREDLQQIHFNPTYSNLEWRCSSIGVFESVIFKNTDPALRLFQPVSWSFPHLEEYPMEDLFSHHPTKTNAWKWEAQIDDLTILSSRINPSLTTSSRKFFDKNVLFSSQSWLVMVNSILLQYLTWRTDHLRLEMALYLQLHWESGTFGRW